MDDVGRDPLVTALEKADDAVKEAQAAVKAARLRESEAQKAKRRLIRKRDAEIVRLAHPPHSMLNTQLGERFGVTETHVRRVISRSKTPPPKRPRVNRRPE